MEMTPQEKAKNKRLWKCYRWTLEMYNALGELQGWRCAGCGKHRDEKKLNLDHYHFKIVLMPTVNLPPDKKWVARTDFEGMHFSAYGKTQKEARENVKDQALPHSVRGLLCAGRHGTGCNTRLGRIDDPDWLDTIRRYLLNPPSRAIVKTVVSLEH
jgi:hypothetical protein